MKMTGKLNGVADTPRFKKNVHEEQNVSRLTQKFVEGRNALRKEEASERGWMRE